MTLTISELMRSSIIKQIDTVSLKQEGDSVAYFTGVAWDIPEIYRYRNIRKLILQKDRWLVVTRRPQ